GHAPQQDRGTRKAAPAPKTAATSARSERFQRSTGATMQRPVREAAAQPAAQAAPAAEETPAKKKKSKLPVILGVAVLVLLTVGLGMFLAGKLGGGQTPAPDGQQAVTLPAMDQSEISELMGGDISVSTREATFTVPLETRNMIERGYKLESAGKDPLPSQLAAGATCDAVLVDPQGVRGQIVYTLQNFLNVPAPVEESVIVAVAIDDIAGQESLAVSCKSGGGELKVTRDTDLETLEQEAEALHLSLQKDPDADCWRVYLDPDGSGAYLEFRLGEDGETLDIYISTGHVVEEYYEAHPPVQAPAQQPHAGGTVVTGMSYDREALLEQMGGDMELYWNGHTMRLPASVLELKEQGFPLDNWSGEPMPQAIAAGIQKTAMIDNEYSDKGYMYIGVHNYTSTEQPVDGCWIADVEIFGVPNYRDLQLNWWTPGGQFYIYSGMTSDEIRQEAANNSVCIMPDEAINSDWPEDMMLSVAQDGSLVQLALFFDENGTLCDMSILMGHVYERYFEMYPEQAVPTEIGPDYRVEEVREAMGITVNAAWDGYNITLPLPAGDLIAQGYTMDCMLFRDVAEPYEGFNAMFMNSAGKESWMMYWLSNFTDRELPVEQCLITEVQVTIEESTKDLVVTVQLPQGTFRVAAGMTKDEVEVQMAALGLRYSDPEPNISTRKVELMDQEGQAFIDVDFNEEGIVKYLRAWVDGYCAKYYGLIPTP
ncbi:MAG: hypothetical protein IJP11_01940, partial [Oscillospiraceae bacterium]|nr:hypothetical protein [Oscillospiraceae bacterium]